MREEIYHEVEVYYEVEEVYHEMLRGTYMN